MKWLSTLLLVFMASSILSQDCNITDLGDLSSDKLYSYQFKKWWDHFAIDTTMKFSGKVYFNKDTGNHAAGADIYIKMKQEHVLYQGDSIIVWDTKQEEYRQDKGESAVLSTRGLHVAVFEPLMNKLLAPLDTTNESFRAITDTCITMGFEDLSIVDTGRTTIYFNEDCFPNRVETYTIWRGGRKQAERMRIWDFDSTQFRNNYFDSIRSLYSNYEEYSIPDSLRARQDTFSLGDGDAEGDTGAVQRKSASEITISKEAYRTMLIVDASKYSSAEAYIDTVERLELTDLKGNRQSLASAVSEGQSIVKFWYIGCGPCIMADKYMEDSVEISDAVNFVHVTPEDTPEEIGEYYREADIDPTKYYATEFVYDEQLIKSYPTFMFYEDGEFERVLKGWGPHVKEYLQKYMEP